EGDAVAAVVPVELGELDDLLVQPLHLRVIQGTRERAGVYEDEDVQLAHAVLRRRGAEGGGEEEGGDDHDREGRPRRRGRTVLAIARRPPAPASLPSKEVSWNARYGPSTCISSPCWG